MPLMRQTGENGYCPAIVYVIFSLLDSYTTLLLFYFDTNKQTNRLNTLADINHGLC
jgi:hypothetical protein